MNHWKIAASIVAAIAPFAARAADDTGHWYWTPEIGRINTDDRKPKESVKDCMERLGVCDVS